jgi:signal transduction histidine kinase
MIAMFAVPLISLIALWVFAAGITFNNATVDHNYNSAERTIELPVSSLLTQLSLERQLSYIWLITGQDSPRTTLDGVRIGTDVAVRKTIAALNSVRNLLSSTGKPQLDVLFTQFGQLGRIRAEVDSGAMSPTSVFQAYSTIVDSEFRFFDTAFQVNDGPLFEATTGSIDAGYSLEMAGREAALVGGALALHGQMSAANRELFASTVANRRLLMGDAMVMLAPSARAEYVRDNTSPEYQQFAAMEDQISASVRSNAPLPVGPGAWLSASGSYLAAMLHWQVHSGASLGAMSAALTDRLVTEAVLAGGVGLAAVVGSVFLLIWFGRRVTGDLTRLHNSVRSMADERLPRVVQRLRQGDDVDVSAESPAPAAGKITEIARVAEAFSTVQASAVEAAVDQAKLRKGINQVFLNLSMRNQSLLHRQLGLLDSMERRTSEPKALADLFRLDHLTTRMRRHAEGLIILSGATPGRGWRDPVPVVDVLRAAVAEVEDYVRVDVVSESRDFVASVAVNDVIHLVAELVENATAFSPPNTRIEVSADRVGTGLVAEIEDRGLGLSPDELAEINQRLASPQEFDLTRSDQLGLFVVGQLATRHGVEVSLRRSPYGGVVAIVLMPYGVVVREEDSAAQTAPGDRPAGSGDATDIFPALAVDAPPYALGSPDDRERAPAFGLTGRHRMPAIAAAAPDPAVSGEPDRPAGPAAPPGPPWEISAPAASWETVPAAPWERAVPPRASAVPPRASAVPPRASAVPPRASAVPPRAPLEPGPSGQRHLGMPIRVPQASLAPQLRAGPGSGAAPRETAGLDERPPEMTRNLVISMQQGWQRGRTDDLGDDDGAPGDGTTDSEAR